MARGGASRARRRRTARPATPSRSSAPSPSATGASWSRWPAELRHPSSPAVARAAAELAPRVAFHAWLQGEVQRQLRDVRARGPRGRGARGARPRRRLRPGGLRRLGAGRTSSRSARGSAPRRTRSASRARTGGCRRGAPTGSTPPATPPTATCVRALLRQADGLRVDHVAGLFRLWWVPPGVGPAGGTYVHYDAEVMLAVLTLEAHRAGALVIGEDLGTVEPEVTEGLHSARACSARPCCGSPATATRPASRCCRRTRGRSRRWRACRRTTCRRPPDSCAPSTCAPARSSGLLDDVAAERGEGGGRAGRAGRAAARGGPGRRTRPDRGRAGASPSTRCWPRAVRGWC